MENVMLGGILFAAIGYLVLSFVRILKGEAGCRCGQGKTCSVKDQNCRDNLKSSALPIKE
ncbi:hypothetical protein V6C32_17520 [Desulforamulus ruminis]